MEELDEQLSFLYFQKIKAIDSYDFDEAEQVQNHINQIKLEKSKIQVSQFCEQATEEFENIKEKYLMKMKNMKKQQDTEIDALFKKFEFFILEAQKYHNNALLGIQCESNDQIHRVKNIYFSDSDQLLSKSIQCAKNSNYSEARKMKEQAQVLDQHILNQQLALINNDIDDKIRAENERFNQEIRDIHQKQHLDHDLLTANHAQQKKDLEDSFDYSIQVIKMKSEARIGGLETSNEFKQLSLTHICHIIDNLINNFKSIPCPHFTETKPLSSNITHVSKKVSSRYYKLYKKRPTKTATPYHKRNLQQENSNHQNIFITSVTLKK